MKRGIHPEMENSVVKVAERFCLVLSSTHLEGTHPYGPCLHVQLAPVFFFFFLTLFALWKTNLILLPFLFFFLFFFYFFVLSLDFRRGGAFFFLFFIFLFFPPFLPTSQITDSEIRSDTLKDRMGVEWLLVGICCWHCWWWFQSCAVNGPYSKGQSSKRSTTSSPSVPTTISCNSLSISPIQENSQNVRIN